MKYLKSLLTIVMVCDVLEDLLVFDQFFHDIAYVPVQIACKVSKFKRQFHILCFTKKWTKKKLCQCCLLLLLPRPFSSVLVYGLPWSLYRKHIEYPIQWGWSSGCCSHTHGDAMHVLIQKTLTSRQPPFFFAMIYVNQQVQQPTFIYMTVYCILCAFGVIF